MMTEEFHKPFLKNMIVIAACTVFAMVSSKFLVQYYMRLEQRDIINTSFETTDFQNSLELPQ